MTKAGRPRAWALIAGGGTAGHALPGISAGRALVAEGHPVGSIRFVAPKSSLSEPEDTPVGPGDLSGGDSSGGIGPNLRQGADSGSVIGDGTGTANSADASQLAALVGTPPVGSLAPAPTTSSTPTPAPQGNQTEAGQTDQLFTSLADGAQVDPLTQQLHGTRSNDANGDLWQDNLTVVPETGL